MFPLGAIGFTAALVICGVSVSPAMLIAARLVQGAVGAILLPQATGTVISRSPRRRAPMPSVEAVRRALREYLRSA